MAPASAARHMFRMWILLRGVSRTQSTRGRFSLSVTSSGALDEVRCIAIGDTGGRSDRCRHDHHRVEWDKNRWPRCADIGTLACSRILRDGFPGSACNGFARPLRPSSSAMTRKPAVGGNEIDELYSLVTLDSAVRSVLRNRDPLAPVVATGEALGWLDGQKRLRDATGVAERSIGTRGDESRKRAAGWF